MFKYKPGDKVIYISTSDNFPNAVYTVIKLDSYDYYLTSQNHLLSDGYPATFEWIEANSVLLTPLTEELFL